jgi:hypothetical protein
MKTHRLGRIRRFHFNLPQRIAAGLLVLFLAQGLWLISHQTPIDCSAGSCGQQMGAWPLSHASSFSDCLNIQDGILACRLAGLPATLNLPALDLLERGTLLAAGALLGGALWWVTRRLYGNLGGYTALALYCFSPAVLKASTTPNAEIVAALGVYGGVYTCIGVAHAMQGPRKKWRPRIVLLTAIFAVTALAHLAALVVVALVGLGFMLWVAEGRRRQVLPVVLIAVAGALVAVFVGCGFSPQDFSFVLRSGATGMAFSLQPAALFFGKLANVGVTLAAAAVVVLYLGVKRSRYFGNTAPLLCALVLIMQAPRGSQGSPGLWMLPFLLTFVGGVFADAYEEPKGRLAMAAAGSILLLQAVFCVLSPLGLL